MGDTKFVGREGRRITGEERGRRKKRDGVSEIQ
jgi:hypothetical protein